MLCICIFYDENNYFLEFLHEISQMENLNLNTTIELLLKQSNELTAIIVA